MLHRNITYRKSFVYALAWRIVQVYFAVGLLTGSALAEDWPAYMHDNRCSGYTSENLNPASLKSAWTFTSPVPPHTAWAGPAPWDAYINLSPLTPMRDFDPVFYVTAVGNRVYFGYSVTDAVHCYVVS